MVSDKRCAALVVVGLAALFVVGGSGCSDDLYSPCTPDAELQCEDADVSACVSRPNFQCSSRVCGKYEGSEPFCTQACSSDGDCPNGSCEIFVQQKGQAKYCAPSSETS